MGLRERFRARRKLSLNRAPPPPSTNTQPSSTHSNAPDGSSSLFVPPFGERSATPLDHVQDDASSRFKLFERSSYGSEVMHEAPSSSSGTSSLRLAASRMGRSIKDKILRRDPTDSSWENNADQPDVPEISEADCRIAEYAAATVAPESITRSPALASADVDTLTKHSCGDLVPMGAEIPDGVKCNDGCISLVVPDGWAAIRMPDCFCLFTDMAVGYVRTVPASEAVNALVETDRLQVMSAVTVTTSPVFVAPDLIQVEYSASKGIGRGSVRLLDFYSPSFSLQCLL